MRRAPTIPPTRAGMVRTGTGIRRTGHTRGFPATKTNITTTPSAGVFTRLGGSITTRFATPVSSETSDLELTGMTTGGIGVCRIRSRHLHTVSADPWANYLRRWRATLAPINQARIIQVQRVPASTMRRLTMAAGWAAAREEPTAVAASVAAREVPTPAVASLAVALAVDSEAAGWAVATAEDRPRKHDPDLLTAVEEVPASRNKELAYMYLLKYSRAAWQRTRSH